MTDWQPEPREVLPELTEDFEHATFTPQPTIAEVMSGIPIGDRLDEVMRQRLTDLFGAL